MLREVGPATLKLDKRGDGIYLKATVNMNGSVWEGVGAFPLEAEEEAQFQFDRIQTPTELEDMVRAWADEETWASYQEFRNEYGF